MSRVRHSLGQFWRFCVVGLVSNSVLYLIYLVLTWYGLTPQYAVTILFIMGTVQTFIFNKKWSFSCQSRNKEVFLRYALSYFSAYCLNLVIFFVAIDMMNWPHQIVEAVVIVVLAIYLFALQKMWIFTTDFVQQGGFEENIPHPSFSRRNS